MILITGAYGQLGSELRKLLDKKEITYCAKSSSEMDISNRSMVKAVFDKVKPSIVFHCAAYTAVDKAEGEGRDANKKINVDGTRYVAESAESMNATMVYISTDYIFDGTKLEEYVVEDSPNPQSEYGRTKNEGEQIVRDTCSKFYIVRTSWVFGEFGHNFVHTMHRLAETNEKLTVVSDQYGRPTWTRTLAEFMVHLIEQNSEYGIYHLSNDGSCSWHEFALEILKNTNVEIIPVTSEQYPQVAYRPKHSIMDLSKAKATGFYIPTWKEALRTFSKEINN